MHRVPARTGPMLRKTAFSTRFIPHLDWLAVTNVYQMVIPKIMICNHQVMVPALVLQNISIKQEVMFWHGCCFLNKQPEHEQGYGGPPIEAGREWNLGGDQQP